MTINRLAEKPLDVISTRRSRRKRTRLIDAAVKTEEETTRRHFDAAVKTEEETTRRH